MNSSTRVNARSAHALAQMRPHIIAVVIIAALAFAGAGGIDLWHEIIRSAQADPIAPQASQEPAPVESPATPTPLIRIERSHRSATVDPAILSAWQAYRDGDLDIALQRYNTVIQDRINNHKAPSRDALMGMAAIAQQNSQDALAAEYYNQILALDPHDPYAHAGMSSLLAANGTPGNESRLKLLLAQRPEVAELHFALGNLYAEQSRWGEAEQAYFNACEREHDNARFAFNLAVSLDHLGQIQLASQHYQRALRLDSTRNPSFNHAQVRQHLNELSHRE